MPSFLGVVRLSHLAAEFVQNMTEAPGGDLLLAINGEKVTIPASQVDPTVTLSEFTCTMEWSGIPQLTPCLATRIADDYIRRSTRFTGTKVRVQPETQPLQ